MSILKSYFIVFFVAFKVILYYHIIEEVDIMSDPKREFQRNLLRLISSSGKSQIEISKRLGIPPQTINGWCTGVAVPRMNKVEMLAEFFGVSVSDLLEPPKPKAPACDFVAECIGSGTRQIVGKIARLDDSDRRVVSMMIDSMLTADKYQPPRLSASRIGDESLGSLKVFEVEKYTNAK